MIEIFKKLFERLDAKLKKTATEKTACACKSICKKDKNERDK